MKWSSKPPLATRPGYYYWRLDATDPWNPVQAYNGEALSPYGGGWLSCATLGGEWGGRVPSPAEAARLRARAREAK
jgi:hypothetical protein